MRVISFAILFCFLLAVTCCNHTPAWRLVSKDCYEDAKAQFIQDSAYYREIERMLPPYLDSVTYNDRTRIELNTIDSLITQKHVATTLKRFFKKMNLRTMIVRDNKDVYFIPYDWCTSEMHSADIPVTGDWSFRSNLNQPEPEHCHDTIYCISYQLSERWNYTTVVNH